jgi:hypothetical protein
MKTTNKTNQRNNSMKTNIKAVTKMLTHLLAAVALACTVPAAWADDQVPFQGSAEGAIASVSPDPGGVVLTVLAEGNATQLGRFSREETILLNPATGTVTGLIVFTAANGDQLFSGVVGGFISPNTATGTYTFTGGTGRFANATGGADFIISTPDGVHFSVEFNGTLSSVGSNTP